MTKKAPFIFLVVVAGVVIISLGVAFMMKPDKEKKQGVDPQPSAAPTTTVVAPGTAVKPPARAVKPPAPTPKAPVPAPTPEPMNGALFGTTWKWQKTTLKTGTFTPKNPERFVLSFETRERMVSHTDCNSVSGKYTANAGYMSIGPLTSTLMYCKDSQETIYSGYLTDVIGYTVSASGNTLTLNLKGGAGTMTFTRVLGQ